MTDLFDRAQDLALAELEQLQARRLERATRVVEVPMTPVHCLRCSGLIDPRRIRAMPGTRHCVECAELEERRGRR